MSRVKDEAKIASRGTDWDDAEICKIRKFKMLFCVRKNSVFDGLRSNLFKFIQESMSVEVVVRNSRDKSEFVGVQ